MATFQASSLQDIANHLRNMALTERVAGSRETTKKAMDKRISYATGLETAASLIEQTELKSGG